MPLSHCDATLLPDGLGCDDLNQDTNPLDVSNHGSAFSDVVDSPVGSTRASAL